MSIKPAKITFNSDGTPVATEFDDVYFSNTDGLEETRYVFLQHNRIPQRFVEHCKHSFVIAETGFGTGLNFLTLWQAFDQFRLEHPEAPLKQLHFISTEKFPLRQQDLQAALDKWPTLAREANGLVEYYPDLVDGCHRLQFAKGTITLDLWFGDVLDSFPAMHNDPQGIVDAWFLDGFAPSKNPKMWSDELFAQIARLSKPQATFATFTAAGIVKRGLAQVGFEVTKTKGFGRKREMLMGHFTHNQNIKRDTQQYFQRHAVVRVDTAAEKKLHIGVVGGGIAAANLAISLVQRGHMVSVLFKESLPAQGASGNPQGGFYPQLNAEANITSRLQALAFGFAARRYQQLLQAGCTYAHQWCGVLQLAFNSQVETRQRNLVDNALWPDSLIHGVDAVSGTAIAGLDLPYSSLFIPQGGWICPPELVNAMFDYAQQIGQCKLLSNCTVQSLSQQEHHWTVTSSQQGEMQFDTVVIATGADSKAISHTADLPFNLVRGQVEAIPSQQPLDKLNTVLCHKGYLTPEFQGAHALGSTYVKHDTSRAYRKNEQDINLATHLKGLAHTNWIKTIKGNHIGRAAIRCSLPDHLPVAGAMFEASIQQQQFDHLYKALPIHRYPMAEDLSGLYILSGLGSRGLTTAPLLADLIASQISAEPLPLSHQLLNALNPNRFLIRQLIRQQGDIKLKSNSGKDL
ncbi:bifunctional tRNA (5-methylaminomethyl-2-thiouridine)(34)-methyltransferase MnmD/FAD-dependent 5-carboxymethylaminomethyl-2-thiouridine(34) oxidoreductase MnmC [Aliiglaciecola sp. LCG003]|uniref:bifunctional tRNA (5-methylaminomethyl-2-thiouridine)(34)-methyltransferase MnmD/FAD-dependent 5-carboxymethylaminomethyl-2-thiouridine(34) oxidoreductase MnmC n=1 Tax=Aliiglaciecola sp. LCG003 TaxID=3053655 RepID=UPI002574363F|nr:bifunctional tRNA (5-methylaminomethyl-2-thiouridine)(34)-methyltransferase MnmD/FAD-dependent 5-carboxymethylaminomethyl-2-thiouridine(34) oxidoreductase MnmC [Aliiglaciecola sp. LCG003]WJG08298.1 bifunctional tRNA (5-methylaminomethyl-2-thiouridine)(34)-methyltransferase MnmD/FAD-dependent 5-carboxymethylaminomethyl-2-thiouridine(34) oxidoreductase MnmC [Aliiglaciecola sp. LCG003]